METTRRGVPTVMLVTEGFVRLAQSIARAKGHPDLPMVVLPHPIETLGSDHLVLLADAKFPEIVAKLTSLGRK